MKLPPRADHIAWCKDRALEYLDDGDTARAIASMASDLGKLDETRITNERAAEGLAAWPDVDAVRAWIESFK